ncbi:hypothetical protein AC477_05305 [miscellaneous Crenarchaeota group-1 archaeon SG8-32-1]|uniref:Ribosomal RNA small subunit methyltransferase Nep1 n=1 Tax=miscellaneous Crenarchaeota group-1 archaeon SG8-32-1 TaxID=1685124 RepID=A0A0M0BNU9_9ARCH|nr:MAG: hypothetical protein AC477_05305 [miscellaneous Crenarchaeota group-1 archaeon SG8-32-1]
MLTLILAEAALETIPEELWSHASVRRHSKRRRKSPKQLILDRSLHHLAMKRIGNDLKRGRPDITHFVLLEALGSPLNKEKLLRVYVHTNQDYIITINPVTRLPKNYTQFIGLMEQLFEHEKVPHEGETLLDLKHKTLQQFFSETKPSYVLAFSTQGKSKTIQDVVSVIQPMKNPTVIIGGFAHEHFKEETARRANEIVSVDSEMLEAWTLTSRLIYEYEKSISLPTKRLHKPC